MEILTVTGVVSFDFFFSIFIYFIIGVTPILLSLILLVTKWFNNAPICFYFIVKFKCLCFLSCLL
ncbi:hypothetical protein F3L46_08645 [Campylobacter jejuni]|nr:hypothetical protein [Campylobacter jejuni]